MSEWAMKRFWTKAAVAETDSGFAVHLDGRPVRTPAKAHLVVPTQALAQAIANEWEAQEKTVNPAAMPMTRGANAAIDKLSVQFEEVADNLAGYGDSDLLCYRASGPEALIARQAAAWDPPLDWAAQTFDARLEPRTGVMHAAQDPAALARLRQEVHALSPFQLAAFHDLVSLTGSLILGLAAIHDYAPPEALWDLSRIDESWQEEQWGRDEEATERAEFKRGEFFQAFRFYNLT